MKAEFKSIVLLLTTQAMMNMGEINDPVSNDSKIDKENSLLFISLLEELEKKTRGNLADNEEKFLNDVINNLNTVFKNKFEERIVQ